MSKYQCIDTSQSSRWQHNQTDELVQTLQEATGRHCMSKQQGSTCYCSEMGAVSGEAESELGLLAAQFQMTLHELSETVVNVSVNAGAKFC